MHTLENNEAIRHNIKPRNNSARMLRNKLNQTNNFEAADKEIE